MHIAKQQFDIDGFKGMNQNENKIFWAGLLLTQLLLLLDSKHRLKYLIIDNFVNKQKNSQQINVTF